MKGFFKAFLAVVVLGTFGCFQKKGPVLRIGNITEPATLDPQLAPGFSEAKIITALFEGLLVPDNRTLEPLPGMASSYTVSPDGLEYTFALRNDIFWSNGNPVVAKNFVDAVERGLSPSIASPWLEFYFALKNAKAYYDGKITNFFEVGIEAKSSKTLTFTLEKPIAFFPSLLTHWAWFPVNRKSIEETGDFFSRDNRWTKTDNIVSNGPYLLKSVEVGAKIIVEKNKRYWDAKNVNVEEAHFISGVDASTEENMFIAGQLDITDNVPSDKIKFYREQGTLRRAASLGTAFYWFNCKKKPFDDVRVRRALSFAIDRSAIGDLRNRGSGFEAYSLVPPGTLDYAHRDLFQFDVSYAKKLLAEAGYPDGENFPKTTILFNTSDNLKVVGEAVQEMWRKYLNVDVNLQSIEWGVFLAERRKHIFDICRGNWVGDFNDATTFLNLLSSKDSNNHAQWANGDYDRLLSEASKEKSSPRRIGILAKAEKLMIEEMPIIPIYFDSFCHLVSKRVEGWYPNILDWHPLKNIRFIEE
ncbi:MAG: peptide ABC transporter substrate-binding protein [Puniceicoccales bacterium]|jgi:oligopeptide transport system substrate-binding protein|nr:peptide ABC transporter substrate-binding protein [Puniceicoccales bacterium]